jgi:hypothetical protein
MRHLRITFGLALTAGVLAVAAAPALAAPVFKASAVGKEYSEAEPGTTKGLQVTETEQEFNFGGLIIRCPKATAKGQVAWSSSKTLAQEVKFIKCSTIAREGTGKTLLLATSITPTDFVFHANGFAETGTEFASEAEISGGKALMKISGVRGKCVIAWPAQTIPVRAIKHPEEEFSAVTYSNNEFARPLSPKLFPSGFQTRLVISSELKGMKWEVAEGCENFETTKGTGRFIGAIEVQVVGGNLEIGAE